MNKILPILNDNTKEDGGHSNSENMNKILPILNDNTKEDGGHSNSENKARISLKEKIMKEAFAGIESWTVHGLPKVLRSKYISIKIFWTILFLGCLGATLYFLVNTIKEYYKYNVSTSVSSIEVDELDLPLIIICNKNQIKTQFGYDYYEQMVNETYGYGEDFTNGAYFNGMNAYYWNFFSLDIKRNSPYKLFYRLPFEERAKTTPTFDEMVFNYDADITHLKKSEIKSNWFFNPYYGNCYEIKTEKKLKPKFLQNSALIQVWLHAEFYNAIDRALFFSRGLYIGFASQNINKFVMLDNMIPIDVGYNHKFILKKSVFYKYLSPYSNCDLDFDQNGNYFYPSTFSKKYYNQIIDSGYEYTQSLCYSFCNLDIIGNNCTLRVSSINAPNNLNNFCPDKNIRIIGNDSILENTFQNMFLNDAIEEKCSKMCPLECKYEKFDLFSTQSQINEISAETLTFSVEYDSFKYLEYREYPSISNFNLFCNVGGSISLLLGMSFFSILEFGEMILLILVLSIRYFYRKYKRNNHIANA